jgi:hypothetical protein
MAIDHGNVLASEGLSLPLLKVLAENSFDSILITDAEGRILAANRAFLNQVELANEHLLRGQSLVRWPPKRRMAATTSTLAMVPMVPIQKPRPLLGLGTASITCCKVVAKFSTMTMTLAPESLSWCSSSRGVYSGLTFTTT